MKKKKDDFKAFELSNWKDGVAIKREGKEKKKREGKVVSGVVSEKMSSSGLFNRPLYPYSTPAPRDI